MNERLPTECTVPWVRKRRKVSLVKTDVDEFEERWLTKIVE